MIGNMGWTEWARPKLARGVRTKRYGFRPEFTKTMNRATGNVVSCNKFVVLSAPFPLQASDPLELESTPPRGVRQIPALLFFLRSRFNRL
jgi:hypothetical protein